MSRMLDVAEIGTSNVLSPAVESFAKAALGASTGARGTTFTASAYETGRLVASSVTTLLSAEDTVPTALTEAREEVLDDVPDVADAALGCDAVNLRATARGQRV